MNNNTVFLLGAGTNLAKNMIILGDVSYPAKVPLVNNFFIEALHLNKFNDENYTKKIQIVYDYIEKYWRMDKDKLANSNFDLEECFTLLETQYREARDSRDTERTKEMFDIQFRLKRFVAEVLSNFSKVGMHSAMTTLGEIIYNEKPIVITFNYDCFLEDAIERASHLNRAKHPGWRRLYDRSPITEEELTYSSWNWNRPLGYPIKFDEVMIHDRGISSSLYRKYVNGRRFYSHPNHKLYPWYILKLHGSINWFRYIPKNSLPQWIAEPKITLPKEKQSHIILGEGDWGWNDYPELDQWPIDPIIVAPVLHKKQQFEEPPYSKLLPLWEKAKAVLSSCKKLIIIGYSFPPTDFLTKKIFLEAFAENDLKELIVVNPNSEAVNKAKKLCHFDNPEIFKNLDYFYKPYAQRLRWY